METTGEAPLAWAMSNASKSGVFSSKHQPFRYVSFLLASADLGRS